MGSRLLDFNLGSSRLFDLSVGRPEVVGLEYVKSLKVSRKKFTSQNLVMNESPCAFCIFVESTVHRICNEGQQFVTQNHPRQKNLGTTHFVGLKPFCCSFLQHNLRISTPYCQNASKEVDR